ncbi:hypothetical protein B1A67_00900 [Clostridium botulinum D/C]|uniref:hypothetical protein n=1 Tax=Clostridium botulinum TaxID=1491 RepID=UPI000993F629|nr:hypothetical protein [Clostridium botulinum]OOV53120.1 hypothetical protein B1A66_00855 [Clostridium botulinum D/C]OOV58312.1 hypothetical protein B0673_02415 [Clostridium botulinum D/C]OOV59625.1 hypothetical protein B1A67_00900 [Clostridium botulinum D/C]
MNNNLQVFTNEQFGQVRMTQINGKSYAVANDVLKSLGYSEGSWRTTLSRHCKSVAKYDIPHPRSRTKTLKANFIGVQDVLTLIQISKTVTERYKTDFIYFLENNNFLCCDMIILTSRREVEFLSKLESVLEPFGYDCERQFNVCGYRLDFYIKDLNIAIEYDEDDHKNYSYKQQEERQFKIEQELQCRFIRVSDKDADLWNVGYILKNLFNN